MEMLKEKIEQLEQKQELWYTEPYDSLLKGENIKEFCEVLDEVKDCIVKNGEVETFNALKEYVKDNDELLDDIRMVVNTNLKPYYACEVLRSRIKNASITTMQIRYLFKDIFDKYIIRYDEVHEEVCNEIDITVEQFYNMADSFKEMLFKGIMGHFSKNSMQNLFQELTGMDEIYAEIFAELYDVNYKELQAIYIIDNINY